jgi:hypothetical protein
VLLLVLAVACGQEDGGGGEDAGSFGDASRGMDSGAPGDGARVELGTGTTAYRELPATGASLDLVHGPQGGWHVDLAVRIYVDDPEGAILAYEGRDPATGAVITMPSRFMLRTARLTREGDHWLRVADRAIFDVAEPADVVGRDVEVVASLERTGAVSVSDRRTITVVDDDGI